MPAARKVTQVTIVTGALGVGKTTLLQHLLKSKPEGQQWAVLVNEFGKIGVDGALLAQSAAAATEREAATTVPGTHLTAGGSIVVKELAGGCMCCTLAGPLGASIAQLLRQVKPDRLFIEPSGMGHPAGLLDVLQNQYLKPSLQLCAVLCLVDVRSIADPGWLAHDTFQDQVHVADILIGHKADVASAEQLSAFFQWAHELYPPKLQVLTAAHGHIDPHIMRLSRDASFVPMFTPRSATPAETAQLQAPALDAAENSNSLNSSLDSAPCALLKRKPRRFASSSTPTPNLTPAPAANDETNAAQHASALALTPANVSSMGHHTVGVSSSTACNGQITADSMGSSCSVPDVRSSACSQGGVDASYNSIVVSGGRPIYSTQHEPPRSQTCPARPPRRQQAHDPQSYMSCGWLFSPDDMFDKVALLQLLQALQPVSVRVKGIFRVGKSYVVPTEGTNGQLTLQPLAYRRESRLEIIMHAPNGKQQHVAVVDGGANSADAGAVSGARYAAQDVDVQFQDVAAGCAAQCKAVISPTSAAAVQDLRTAAAGVANLQASAGPVSAMTQQQIAASGALRPQILKAFTNNEQAFRSGAVFAWLDAVQPCALAVLPDSVCLDTAASSADGGTGDGAQVQALQAAIRDARLGDWVGLEEYILQFVLAP